MVVELPNAVTFLYGAPLVADLPVASAYGVVDRLDADKVGRIGTGISTGQDPGTINGRARLYAHILLIPVSNGAGLRFLSFT